jgi:hypothetical protein
MIVTDLDAATEAVTKVGEFDRAAIRTTAVKRFGRDRMVDEYVAVYEHVLAGARRVS